MTYTLSQDRCLDGRLYFLGFDDKHRPLWGEQAQAFTFNDHGVARDLAVTLEASVR